METQGLPRTRAIDAAAFVNTHVLTYTDMRIKSHNGLETEKRAASNQGVTG